MSTIDPGTLLDAHLTLLNYSADLMNNDPQQYTVEKAGLEAAKRVLMAEIKKHTPPAAKPETEPVQIEGAPTVQNVLCIIDFHPDSLPEEFKSFIDDAPDEFYKCISFEDTAEHHPEHIYSNYAIQGKLSEVEHAPIVKETFDKIEALLAANDAAYFRLVY